MMFPDTLSRDTIPKPLFKRCFNPLTDKIRKDAEAVSSLRESAIFVNGPSVLEMRDAQENEFGDICEYSEEHEEKLVAEKGILRIEKDGDLAVFVPTVQRNHILSFAHGSRLTENYRMRRTMERIRGRF